MLAPIFFLFLLIAALSLSGAETISSFSKSKIIHARNVATDVVLDAAQAQALASIRAQLQSGATTITPPTYAAVPLCPPKAADGATVTTCQRTSTVQYTFSGSTSAGNASQTGAAVTANNTSQAVAEGRLAVSVNATVFDNGVPVATRTQLVTYQTLNVSPYATVVSTLDSSGGANVATAGDIAGCDPGNPRGCDSRASGVADDTRINYNATCVGNATECAYTVPPNSNYTTRVYNNVDASAKTFSR